jgi:signal transduction histidine kinase
VNGTAISSRGAARILVVDDHAVNCELLEAMLAPHGYDVEQALSGPEALQRIQEHRPDLVLLDVSMPGMDGFEVMERLRRAPETRLLPVVMVTALGDLEYRVRGLESGADDYLPKPVNRHELLARVQSALRLSYYRREVDERQKLDLVLADVTDGFLITDAQGRLRDANPSARRLLGLPAQLGQPSLSDLWGELRGAPEDLGGALQRGVGVDFVLHRDEPPLFLAASLRPVLDPDGAASGAVLSLRDVTRETLDHKLQQDVLSLVSHKFRTPLTVISLWTKMLLEGDCGPITDQQREALDAMIGASDQLRGLLEGMLSYIEWTKQLRRLQPRWLPFEEIESSLRYRTQKYLGTQHRFVVERDGQGDVFADADLFLEVLAELVRNAVKFGGGKPVEVRVEMHRSGEQRTFAVSDDGPGIPPEQLERIFERFYQVETDFTGQVHGVGLGLALVKTAVEAMGGRIQVQSRLQQGTRFEILF